MNDRFHAFLSELADVFRFASLSPDGTGACRLLMRDPPVDLLFEFDDELVPNTILVSARLHPLSVQNRAEILEECLKGNSFQEATISCKPDEEYLYIHQRLHPEIQAVELESLLHEFTSRISYWRKRLEQWSLHSPSPLRFPKPPSTFDFLPKK